LEKNQSKLFGPKRQGALTHSKRTKEEQSAPNRKLIIVSGPPLLEANPVNFVASIMAFTLRAADVLLS